MTPRQAQTLAYIRRHIAAHEGVSPSYDEIAAGIGCRSRGNVNRLVASLAEIGALRRRPNASRSIELTPGGRAAGGAPEVERAIEARALALLADVLDNPLIVLPGAHPGEVRREGEELRLAHFRPDLSEKIAILLDEAGA